jgi:hypothetical protein
LYLIRPMIFIHKMKKSRVMQFGEEKEIRKFIQELYSLVSDRDVLYNIVKERVKSNMVILKFLPEKYDDNFDIMMITIEKNPHNLENVSLRLRNNYDFVMKTVKMGGYALEYASCDLRNNYDLVMASVENDGTSLEYASPLLRNNADIVRKAVSEDIDALCYIGLELQDDLDFMSEMVNEYPEAVFHLSDRLKKNKNIWLSVIWLNPNFISVMPFLLQRDTDILLQVFESAHKLLKDVFMNLIDDKRYVLHGDTLRRDVMIIDTKFELYANQWYKNWPNKLAANYLKISIGHKMNYMHPVIPDLVFHYSNERNKRKINDF